MVTASSGGEGKGGGAFRSRELPLLHQLVAGCVAGGTSTALLHPLDLLKTRFQATTSNLHRPFLSVPRELKSIYRLGGIRGGLYRGFSANFAGSTCSWGLYFLLYHWIQQHAWTIGDEARHLKGWQYFVSSAMAGATTTLFVNPLWLSKTRLCQPPPASLQYGGLWDCLRKTVQREGPRGLYRGLLLGILGTFHGAIQFYTYEWFKRLLLPNDGDPRASAAPPSIPVYLAMSSTSKSVAALLTYPFQLVRCRIQLTSADPRAPQVYTSIRDVVAKTWRGEGLRGFYKGIVPATLRVLPGTCVTFLVYEKLTAYFRSLATSPPQ